MSGLANLKLAALPPVDAVVRTAAPTAEAIVERYQAAHDALVAAPIYLRCASDMASPAVSWNQALRVRLAMACAGSRMGICVVSPCSLIAYAVQINRRPANSPGRPSAPLRQLGCHYAERA